MKLWGKTETALKAHYALGSTTLATCWKVTLTNGTVITATSHDRDIEFPVSSGVIYLSVAAYTPTDVESGAELAPDNLELEGFLAAPGMTESDLHAGLWDYAAVEIFEVNYKDLTMGRNRVREGTLGEVKTGTAAVRYELRGLTQAYSRRIVRLIQKECDADLGDARCTVDLEPYTFTGQVWIATNNRQFTDGVSTFVANYFNGGKLTWLTGANAGLSMEVKENTAAGVITLHHLMPFTVAVGDTYSIIAGCTKRFAEDCIGKFDNGVNFRGFPHLPGSRIYAGPNSDGVGTAPSTTPPTPGSGGSGTPPAPGSGEPGAAPEGTDITPDAFAFDPVVDAAPLSDHQTPTTTISGLSPGVSCFCMTTGGYGVDVGPRARSRK